MDGILVASPRTEGTPRFRALPPLRIDHLASGHGKARGAGMHHEPHGNDRTSTP